MLYSVSAALLFWACDPSPSNLSESAKAGLAVMQRRGCTSCHSQDGRRIIGPSFRGLYGATITVVAGGKQRKVVVNDAFVIRSLREPNVELDARFPKGGMPLQTLSDLEETQVIAALKYLRAPQRKSDKRGLWPLLLGALLFTGGHLLLSAHPLRRRLVARLGQMGFVGLYSIVATCGISLLIYGAVLLVHQWLIASPWPF